MRVFGCAWKIKFPEVIWSWPRKWAFDHGNGLKLKFSLQTISGSDAHRERERERESARERKPRSRLQRRRRTPSSSPTIARTRSPVQQLHAPVRRSISRRSILRRSISLLDLTSAQSRLRPTDLSLWFWFLLLLWWCGSGVEKIAEKPWKICG